MNKERRSDPTTSLWVILWSACRKQKKRRAVRIHQCSSKGVCVVGLSFLRTFSPLLPQWTRQSGSPVARSTRALLPVTLHLLCFTALVHRHHVIPFLSIHISTRRNSAFFIGYKHAHRPSHATRKTKFYFCGLNLTDTFVLHADTCFDSLLRLWSRTYVFRFALNYPQTVNLVHPKTAWLNTCRNMWT
jgi:hypothetical protein